MSLVTFCMLQYLVVSGVTSKDDKIVRMLPKLTDSHISDMCGGFFRLPESPETTFIYSPNYPHDYSPNTFCIWRIESPHQAKFQVIVQGFTGKKYQGICSHYLEIRARDKDGPVLSKICGDHSGNYTISIHKHLAWIKFKSDNKNMAGGNKRWRIGFHISPQSNKDSSYETELWDYERHLLCKGYQFECRNRECISMSYRCDGINDCGCGQLCDEDICPKHHRGKLNSEQKLFGVFIGFVIFILVCLVVELFNFKERLITEIAEDKEMHANRQRPHKKNNHHESGEIKITSRGDEKPTSNPGSVEDLDKATDPSGGERGSAM